MARRGAGDSMKRKSNTCPACGERKTIAVLYGYPTDHMLALESAGKVRLGGCCQELDAPDRACHTCGWRWNHKTGEGAYEPAAIEDECADFRREEK